MSFETRDQSGMSSFIGVHLRLLVLSAVGLGVLAVGSASAAEHTKDSLDKVRQALANKKAVLVDVRE